MDINTKKRAREAAESAAAPPTPPSPSSAPPSAKKQHLPQQPVTAAAVSNSSSSAASSSSEAPQQQQTVAAVKDERSLNCPYLDTINRKNLDFDFEKQCSVTLSHTNVYACLVCGKFFQGKGSSTPAFTHSLNDDHHVFLNLQTSRIYCLPDQYEVIDSTIDDIKYNLNPNYTTAQQLAQLDRITAYVITIVFFELCCNI